MAELVGNLLVAQSGGPTAVINASLAGVIQEAGRQECIEGIYGGLNGILGILNEELIDIGKEKGFLTFDEVNDMLPPDIATDQIDDVMGMFGDMDIEKVAEIANIAGGIVCEDVGVVPIDKERLLNELDEQIT